MKIDFEYYSYLVLILLCFLISIFRWRSNKREDIILSLILLVTFVSEYVADLLIRKYQNNLLLFHFFNPLQFLLISLYYNYLIDAFRRKGTGIYIGITGVLLSVINSFFIQTKGKFISYFLLFEGLAIIAMILHFFLTTIQEEKTAFFKNKHFWVSVIFLFFWSVTYSYWALSDAISVSVPEFRWAISKTLLYVNMVAYGSLSIVFILNKKHVLHNGN